MPIYEVKCRATYTGSVTVMADDPDEASEVAFDAFLEDLDKYDDDCEVVSIYPAPPREPE